MTAPSYECSKTFTSTSETEIFPGYSSVEQFTKDGFKALTEAIRHSNGLPTGREWDFYSISDSFTTIINDESTNILRMMNQIMRCNDVESNIKNRILDEKIELLVEANDVILEKVANNIDEMNGVQRNYTEPVILQTVSAQLPVNGSWNRSVSACVTINPAMEQSLGANCIRLVTAKNIVRPQKFFKDKIDNSRTSSWCPKITEKPNSLKPLAIFLEDENGQEYSHPYEFELDRFTPTPEQLLEEIPEFPKHTSETPLVEINKPEQLDELVKTLGSYSEFAVDVEHHSYRSFMGITCLMQISTKDKDYLIDALALRDKLHMLNEVFTKNNIVKIFHGADKDIEWLQRDLSIYVVNMFDTHQAAKVLEYSGLSLAFLMKKFCNILPNKQFQLADWRIRPLPDEFKTYAREDTHYLIYIYKMLKNDLLFRRNKSDNLLRAVIERSTEICKKRYCKPTLRDDSHLDMYRKCKKMFDNRQLYALKEIYSWRDNLAREEDESLAYVLPNHMLLQISETLPREMQGILACCNPVPPLVRSRLLELHQIVLRAREQPLEKAVLKEHTTGRGVLKNVSKVNVDSILHCPHDLSKTTEFRDDLPTLLNNNELRSANKNVVNDDLTIEKHASYSIFDTSNYLNTFSEQTTFKMLRGPVYFSPYERYKLVKPFVEENEEGDQAERQDDKKPEEQNIDHVGVGRTHDESIASCNFLKLTKKFNEELQAKQQLEENERARTLLEMGGSRKRKHSFESNSFVLPELSENSLHTPTPNINTNPNKFNKKFKKRGKKRKYNEINSSLDNQEQQQSYNKKNKNRNPNIRNPVTDSDVQYTRNQQKKPWHKQNETSTNVVPYDYSSVDFRQFQGGAGSATCATNIKSKFKSKSRKKFGNKGLRSSTFNGFNRATAKGHGRD